MAKILVVDDERGMREMIKKFLRITHHTVDLADSGPTALNILRGGGHDLAVIDLKMPQMGGEELIEQIRRQDQHMAIIVLTGHGDWATAYDLLKAYHIAEFLHKPIESPQRLIFTIDNALEASWLRKDLRRVVNERTSELAQSEEKFHTFLEFAPTPIVLIDRESRIKYINRKCAEIFGVSRQDLQDLGSWAERALPDSADRRDVIEQWNGQVKASFRTGREIAPFELALLIPSGETAYFLCSMKPVGDIGFLVLSDITEMKRKEQALEQAEWAAQAATKAKSRFLANMSHEIRTPMNGVIGYLDLVLEDPALSEDAQEHLKTARSSAVVLLDLINEILDVSKIEAGKLTLEICRFNLPNLLRDILKGLNIKARNKGLELLLDIHPDLFTCLIGDPLRLRQILVNLVGNAVKFTEKGEIRISVDSESAEMIRFTISDSGVGMSREQIEAIFDPFSQGDVSTTRRFGGTGLGTTISKQLVEMMGGRISVSSPGIGKGAEFTFSLRLETPVECRGRCDPECAEHGDASEPPVPVSKRRFRILLAEDIEPNARLVMIRLGQQGHTILHVWNGAEALEAVREDSFDLVLMDIQMPGVDGLTATREIRRREKGSGAHLPIIALTASIMMEDRQAYLDAGMDAIVGKPIDMVELFRIMEEIVPVERGERIVRMPLILPGSPDTGLPDALPGVDLPKALKLWRDPKILLEELLQFENRFGDAAVRIRRAINQRKIDEAHQIAHALKGVSGNLAIDEVFSCASPLNDRLKATLDEITASSHEVLEMVRRLDLALEHIKPVLENLTEKYKTRETAVRKDPLREKAVLGELIKKLDAYDPAMVEPLLEILAELMEKKKFKVIKAAVDSFDFDVAKGLAQEYLEDLQEQHQGMG